MKSTILLLRVLILCLLGNSALHAQTFTIQQSGNNLLMTLDQNIVFTMPAGSSSQSSGNPGFSLGIVLEDLYTSAVSSDVLTTATGTTTLTDAFGSQTSTSFTTSSSGVQTATSNAIDSTDIFVSYFFDNNVGNDTFTLNPGSTITLNAGTIQFTNWFTNGGTLPDNAGATTVSLTSGMSPSFGVVSSGGTLTTMSATIVIIPEPSSFALAALAFGMFLLRHRRKN